MFTVNHLLPLSSETRAVQYEVGVFGCLVQVATLATPDVPAPLSTPQLLKNTCLYKIKQQNHLYTKVINTSTTNIGSKITSGNTVYYNVVARICPCKFSTTRPEYVLIRRSIIWPTRLQRYAYWPLSRISQICSHRKSYMRTICLAQLFWEPGSQ